MGCDIRKVTCRYTFWGGGGHIVNNLCIALAVSICLCLLIAGHMKILVPSFICLYVYFLFNIKHKGFTSLYIGLYFVGNTGLVVPYL